MLSVVKGGTLQNDIRLPVETGKTTLKHVVILRP